MNLNPFLRRKLEAFAQEQCDAFDRKAAQLVRASKKVAPKVSALAHRVHALQRDVEANGRVVDLAHGEMFDDLLRDSPDEIRAAEAVKPEELIDPETDAARVKKPEWLIMVGVCTHLGCIPLGQKTTEPKGDFAGWFCPCHGSHYDTSGRIRKGPAPKNLSVPHYNFLTDTTIKIG